MDHPQHSASCAGLFIDRLPGEKSCYTRPPWRLRSSTCSMCDRCWVEEQSGSSVLHTHKTVSFSSKFSIVSQYFNFSSERHAMSHLVKVSDRRGKRSSPTFAVCHAKVLVLSCCISYAENPTFQSDRSLVLAGVAFIMKRNRERSEAPEEGGFVAATAPPPWSVGVEPEPLHLFSWHLSRFIYSFRV